MLRLPHTHSCFVCGDRNRLGLHLRFDVEGAVVSTTFTPQPEHAGFRDVTHGGLLATLLDEIMVWAVAVHTRQFAYAAEISVRFTSPAVPGQKLLATAELVSNRKNRIFEAKGELRTETGALVASSTGKYLPVPKNQLEKLRADIAGDVAPFLDILDAPGRAGVTSPEA